MIAAGFLLRADGAGDEAERRIRTLAASLAAARCEADAWRARVEGKALTADRRVAGAVPPGGVRICDVNRALGMVVADAGARQGMQAGLVLMVMRGDRPLARVRVVDVRRRVAGAVVEKRESGDGYPEPGDRLVVATDGE